MNKQEALLKIEELKKFVEDCDKEEKWTPKEGDKYFYLDEINEINEDVNDNESIDNGRITSGNCFQTEALANSEKMRRKSMKRDWLPNWGVKCWGIYNTSKSFVKEENTFEGDSYDMENYYLGRIKKTEAEAQNWIDTYGKYWVEKE